MTAERVARMLEARSVAVVGASERPGSFGLRLATEALRSPAHPEVHFVHPRHRSVLDRPCVPSLADLPDPVDLVLRALRVRRQRRECIGEFADRRVALVRRLRDRKSVV